MKERGIQRGLHLSVIVAPLDAASSVGLAIVLIGVLARNGGMELVGQWAMLQAIVSIASAFDLGMTYGVNRSVATEGPARGFALVARAGVWPLAAAALLGAVAIAAAAIGGSAWLFGVLLALSAGAVQLAAQWLSAIQTGAHRHVYTQGAAMFLNVAQFALVLAALRGFDHPATPMLAIAMLLARLLHLALVLALLRLSPLGLRDWLAAPNRESWRAVRAAAGSFTIFTVVSKWRTPLLRLSVGFFGGDAALGLFAIAQRAPEAISAVFSSGLQTMLAGFAGMKPGAETARFVRRGLEVQVALCLPLFIAFLAFTPSILAIWIGAADADLTLMTRLMCMAGVVGALATPFYWALQAAGSANFMAAVMVGQIALIIAIGAVGFQISAAGAIVFIAAYAALSALTDMLYAIRATRTLFNPGIIVGWIRERRVWLVVILNIAAVWCAALDAADIGLLELIARIGAYGAVSAGISWVAFRRA